MEVNIQVEIKLYCLILWGPNDEHQDKREDLLLALDETSHHQKDLAHGQTGKFHVYSELN